MVYSYMPTYYTSLHDSITSICKTILPFPFKKTRLPAIAVAEHRLSKQHSDNLKWQQESFHHILNLVGLCKEGIINENEVSAFRTHLLETLIALPFDHEAPVILRDKLIFLQELLYAKCISDDEYHASKRPLLQRLAVQGAEIEARDVIVGVQNKESSNEEWSVIDLKDEKTSANQESSTSKRKLKENSTIKKIKGAVSVLVFPSPPDTKAKLKEKDNPVNKLGCSAVRLSGKESDSKSILMMENLPVAEKSVCEKRKTKPFRTLFQREQRDVFGNGCKTPREREKEKVKSVKKGWGFDGFEKWNRSDCEDETAPLSLSEKSDGGSYTGQLVENPIEKGPDNKQIKRKLHPDGATTDFIVDKVLAANIKKELSRIRTQFGGRNPNAHISDDQIEAISIRLPVDMADLKKVFPKAWCHKYGEIVLNVVRKEFKDHHHMAEMGSSRSGKMAEEKRWTTRFDDDDDENAHPNNVFAAEADHQSHHHHHHHPLKQTILFSSKNGRASINSSIAKGFKYNPFFDML